MNTTVRDVQRLMEARTLISSGEARRIREASHLSLLEVGAAVGADPSAVGRWERGVREPRGKAALKYAQLLNKLARQLPSGV